MYAAPFSVWDDEERCEADEDRWDVGNEADESGDIHEKILGKSPEKHGRHSDRDRTYLGEKALTYKSRKKTGRKRRNRKRRRATTSERVERTRTRFLRLDGVSAELAQTATRARRFEQLMGMRESKQVAATISANRRRGLKVHARGVDIAREVLGTSAIQLQSNLKKTGTRHATTRAVPEFGSAVYVDFMPTVPGVAIGPVLLVMEYSGDFVVPVELDSMRLDDVIVGVRRAIWRMDLITRKKVSVFHVDAETLLLNLRMRTIGHWMSLYIFGALAA